MENLNVNTEFSLMGLSIKDLLIIKAITVLNKTKEDGIFEASEVRKLILKEYNVTENDENPFNEISQNVVYNTLCAYDTLGYLIKSCDKPKEVKFKISDKFDEFKLTMSNVTKATLSFLKDDEDNDTSADDNVKNKMKGATTLQLVALIDNAKEELNGRDEGVVVDVVKTFK